MLTLQHLYFRLSIKFRIGLLCFCYSLCMIAAAALGRSDSFAIRYGSLSTFIMLGAFFGMLNIWGMGTSIKRVIGNLQTIAHGNLCQEIVIKHNNEISWILTSIKDVQTSMRSMISEIQATSGGLTSAASNLRQTSESMAAGAAQAVGQTASVVHAVEELSCVSNDITRNCLVMAEKATETRTATIDGERTIGDMSQMMEEIQAPSFLRWGLLTLAMSRKRTIQCHTSS